MVVPAVPEAKYVDAGGIKIHFHDDGEAEKGTVMFIHGSGPGASGWSNFKGNYPYLNQHGYRTLVPDMYGYGYSDKPTEGTYFMQDLAKQFLDMIDALGIEKISLVGNSMGGAVAIQFALAYPERTEKLILMAPGGLEKRETYMGMKGIKTMIANMSKRDQTPEERMRDTFSLQLFNPELITDEIIQERVQVAATQPKKLLQMLVVKNAEEQLAEISVPTLCLWGMNDLFCPPSGAMKVAERVKDSRTVLVNGCGHWLMVEHEQLFNETSVRFLDGEFR